MDLARYGITFPIRDPILLDSLESYLEGKETLYADCLAEALRSDINANLRVGWLTPEQALVLHDLRRSKEDQKE